MLRLRCEEGDKLKQLFFSTVLLLIFSILSACISEQEPNHDKNNKNNEVQKGEKQEAQIPSEESRDGTANDKNSRKQKENDDSIVEITQMFFLGNSENWRGQLIAAQENYTFSVYYIIDEPETTEFNGEDIGNVNYKIKTQNKTIEEEGKLVGNSIPIDDNKVLLPHKDETISVTVEWKGEKETFTMVNKLEEEGVISSKEAMDIAKKQMETISIDYPIVGATYIPFDQTWRVLARNKKERNDYYFIKIHAESGAIVEYEGRTGKEFFHGK
jgi:hypothetical protein